MEKVDVKEEVKTTKCLNCDTEFQGKFCPNCGQKADTGRFTISFIFTNLIQGILSNDGGVWFTLKNLFTRPGAMMVDIINGKRKSYFSPFPMLFLTLAFYVMIFSFTGSKVGNNAFVQTESEVTADVTVEDDMSVAFKTETDKLLQKIYHFYINHYTTSFVLTIPLYLVLARLCYGKANRKRYNWGEYSIPLVYSLIMMVLYQSLTSIAYYFSTELSSFMERIATYINIIIFTVCFKKMMGFSVVKTAWRSILLIVSYWITVILLAVVGTILYVVIHLAS